MRLERGPQDVRRPDRAHVSQRQSLGRAHATITSCSRSRSRVLRTVDARREPRPAAVEAPRDRQLGYGDNAKMMVGFNGPVWGEPGGNGASLLGSRRTTRRPGRPTRRTATTRARGPHRLLRRRARQEPRSDAASRSRPDASSPISTRCCRARNGRATKAAASTSRTSSTGRRTRCARGSYTCYLPGQFTTIAGNEGKPVGNLHFAGEHANSFYDWQGFMEGALLSGIDAADAILE